MKFSCKDPNSVLFGKNSGSCNKNGEWSVKVPECLGWFWMNFLILKISYRFLLKSIVFKVCGSGVILLGAAWLEPGAQVN